MQLSRSCFWGQTWDPSRWRLNFRRRRFAWEEDQIHLLKIRLDNVIFDHFNEDSQKWEWDKNGRFSVKSLYDKVEDVGVGETSINEKVLATLNVCP